MRRPRIPAHRGIRQARGQLSLYDIGAAQFTPAYEQAIQQAVNGAIDNTVWEEYEDGDGVYVHNPWENNRFPNLAAQPFPRGQWGRYLEPVMAFGDSRYRGQIESERVSSIAQNVPRFTAGPQGVAFSTFPEWQRGSDSREQLPPAKVRRLAAKLDGAIDRTIGSMASTYGTFGTDARSLGMNQPGTINTGPTIAKHRASSARRLPNTVVAEGSVVEHTADSMKRLTEAQKHRETEQARANIVDAVANQAAAQDISPLENAQQIVMADGAAAAADDSADLPGLIQDAPEVAGEATFAAPAAVVMAEAPVARHSKRSTSAKIRALASELVRKGAL